MPRPEVTLFFALPLFFARADSITFRTGGEVEGVIVAETPADVTLKTGPGTATFAKSQLRSIFRDTAANAELERAWQNQYFSSPDFVPPSLRPLARKFAELPGLENAASRAQKQLQNQRGESEKIEAEMRSTGGQQVEIAKGLHTTDPAAHMDDYNKLVRANNDLVARFTLLQNRREQITAQETANRAAISGYLTTLAIFRDEFEAARAKPVENGQARTFFEQAGAQLAAMRSRLQEVKIPVTDAAHGQSVVTARVNDRDDVRLLVDTGASVVTFSAASAARLRLKWDAKQKVKMTLADGTEIDAHPVRLESLRVGDARVESIAAVVLPQGVSDGIDGLLGMSFLREFDVQLDNAHGQILLHRMPPAR